jgi:hypothetical protein
VQQILKNAVLCGLAFRNMAAVLAFFLCILPTSLDFFPQTPYYVGHTLALLRRIDFRESQIDR